MSNLSSFFDTDSEHQRRVQEFIDNMNFLKSLTVQEYTLYKKWEALNFNFNQEISNLRIVKNKIWKPADINDESLTISEIENLSPKVIQVSDSIYDWNIIREFCHTMIFEANIGRNLKFMLVDETSGKYLGCLNIGSDIIAVNSRDSYIGWSINDKHNGKLMNTAIGSCIMPTQPLGYNFLGGKLAAIFITSKTVRDSWEERYNNKLVGFTTTSLYGSYSMYNSIPYWKSVGSSSGKVTIKADDKVYDYWHTYIKDNYKKYYDSQYNANNSIGVSSSVKQKIISIILKELGMKSSQFQHGYERGVYFCPIYTNTNDFLCGKIQESELVMSDRYRADTQGMLEWWKPKAIKRYKTLKQDGKLNSSILFYDDLIGISWEEAKEKYIDQVGR